MQVSIPRILRAKGPDGTEVNIDISNIKMSSEESEAFDRLASAGDVTKVSTDDLEKLKGLKAQIQGGDANILLIVRFDLSWVRID